VLILANSGIRHGREALELKWSNISFEKSKKDNDVVTIVATKKKGRKATEERRTVVVRHNDFSDFKKILTRIKDRNPQLQAMTLEQIIKKRMDVLLFCLSDGTQPARIDGTFKKFLTDADLGVGAEGIQRTLYSFRHFYATQELLREPPITIHLLAKQMGTSVKMIEHHYGHTEPFQKADRLSGWNDI
jgi:integrase